MKVYPFVDVVKFVLCFLVIAIHCNSYSLIPEKLCELAVPLFFVFSGFFIFPKVVSQGVYDSSVWRYVLKLLRLYLTYTIVFFPLAIYGFIHSDMPFIQALYRYIRNFLLIGSQYYSWHLWYVLATIVAVSLIALLSRKWKLEAVFVFAVVLSALGLLLDMLKAAPSGNSMVDGLVSMYFRLFFTVRNGFFWGLLYVSTGMLIRKYEAFLICRYRIVSALLLVAVVFYIRDIMTTKSLVVCLSGSLCFLPALNRLVNPDVSKTLRQVSVLVFFFHLYFCFLFVEVLSLDSTVAFFAVSVSSVAFAALLLYLIRWPRFHWLRFFLA